MKKLIELLLVLASLLVALVPALFWVSVNVASYELKLLGIFFIALFALVVVMAYYSARVIAPIKKLTDIMDSISTGRAQDGVDPSLTGLNDEIGDLARAFSRMTVSLKLAMKLSAPELKKEIKAKEHEATEKRIELFRRLESINNTLDQSSIVSFTDVAGNITYANDKFCEISKYSRDELIGQNHRIGKSGFHSPQFYQNLWNEITHGRAWRGDLRNRAKDGSIYWVRSTIMPMFDESHDEKGRLVRKISGYVAVRVPITDIMAAVERDIAAGKETPDIERLRDGR
ncbi:MAG: PAS domain S-box protein [Candidatus Aenigmatarchaeota archaeon]|nr:MAG: PAS domain S-box protein [Candidatus Aenigmarchaeota archaeon]